LTVFEYFPWKNEVIFLNIITCMIDFFAMTSPGHFSYPDLFLLDYYPMTVSTWHWGGEPC